VRCPASVVFTEQLASLLGTEIKTRSSPDAVWGTCAHALALNCLLGLTAPQTYLGQWIGEEGDLHPARAPDTIQIEQDMIDLVEIYINNLATCGAGASLREYELEVPLSHITGEVDATGTADAVYAYPECGVLQIHDLKTGRVPVQVAGNYQLLLYAGGAMALLGAGMEIDVVELYIHQPPISATPSTVSYTSDEVRHWLDIARVAAQDIDAMRAGDMPLRFYPHPDTCRYCPAGAHCESRAQFTVAAAAEDFPDLDLGADAPDPYTALSRKYAACEALEAWIQTVREETERVLLSGGTVPGFRLAAGKAGPRYWTDPATVEQYLRGRRVKADVMYTKQLISPPQAEKLVKSGALREGYWNALAPYVARKQNRPRIVSSDSLAPAWSPTSETADFESLL
jgi:hypothetical protein